MVLCRVAQEHVQTVRASVDVAVFQPSLLSLFTARASAIMATYSNAASAA